MTRLSDETECAIQAAVNAAQTEVADAAINKKIEIEVARAMKEAKGFEADLAGRGVVVGPPSDARYVIYWTKRATI